MDCSQKNLGTCGEWGGGEVGNDFVGMAALCRYCQLEVGSTLCDNLKHKKVVEFPILHVVMSEESNIYKGKVVKWMLPGKAHLCRLSLLSCLVL